MNTVLKTIFLFSLISLFAFVNTALAADASPVLVLQTQITHDSNVNLAAAAANQIDELFEEIEITAGRRYQLSSFNRFTLAADLKTAFYKDYTKLNDMRLGLNASYLKKMGLGAKAPWVRLDAGATWINARDAYHDGMEYSGGITAGKNLSNQFGMTASFSRKSRTAKGNDVYSGNGYATAFTAGYVFSSGMKMTVGYAQRRGDAAYHYTGAYVAPPPTLDEDEVVFDQYAYRRVSRTRMSSITLSYPINDTTTVFLGCERHDSLWTFKSYSSDITRLGLVKRYH